MIFAIGLRILALDSIPTAQWVIFLSASHTARGGVCKQFIPKQVCISCGLLLVCCFYFSGILHMHPPWQPSAPELTHRQAACLPPLLLPGSYPWITVVTVHISASDHTGFYIVWNWDLGRWIPSSGLRKYRFKSGLVPEDRLSLWVWGQSGQQKINKQTNTKRKEQARGKIDLKPESSLARKLRERVLVRYRQCTPGFNSHYHKRNILKIIF